MVADDYRKYFFFIKFFIEQKKSKMITKGNRRNINREKKSLLKDKLYKQEYIHFKIDYTKNYSILGLKQTL